mmetsp:Transcript_11776/g.49613  ORF Transcript_11776/g.49613 Transcript_11776/m.49613 type:complete len:535 (-) Transcript_11776:87-1691(-)|eukprot:PRCOL_00004413-RA
MSARHDGTPYYTPGTDGEPPEWDSSPVNPLYDDEEALRVKDERQEPPGVDAALVDGPGTFFRGARGGLFGIGRGGGGGGSSRKRRGGGSRHRQEEADAPDMAEASRLGPPTGDARGGGVNGSVVPTPGDTSRVDAERGHLTHAPPEQPLPDHKRQRGEHQPDQSPAGAAFAEAAAAAAEKAAALAAAFSASSSDPAKKTPISSARLVHYSPLTKLLAALSYGSISMCITIFNKMVFSWYGFSFPCVLTLLQLSLTLVLMLLLRVLTGDRLLDFNPLPPASTLVRVLPLTICWWVYVVSGLIALRYLSVPMFSVFRRATTMLVMVGEFVVLDKTPSLSNVVSVALMMLGGLVAGVTDLMYTFPGYVMVSVLVVSTACYLLLIKLLRSSTGLSDAGLLWCNNVLAMPLMLAYTAVATDELQRVQSFPRLFDGSFIAFLILSASQAFLLNLCIFRCTNINSPLVTSVTGQIKDVLTTTLGFVMFPADAPIYAPNVLGVCIGLLGGMHYSYNSYIQSTRGVSSSSSMKKLVEDKKADV